MEQRFAGNIIHYSLKLLILYLDAIWIIKEENIYVKLLIADFADNSFSDEVGANAIWLKSSPENRSAIRIWRRVTKTCFYPQPYEPIRWSPTKSLYTAERCIVYIVTRVTTYFSEDLSILDSTTFIILKWHIQVIFRPFADSAMNRLF